MADLIVVYWKDIPAQVKIRRGRETLRRELSARFAEAIDMAAMRSGDKDSDSYLAGWRTGDPIAVDGDLDIAIDRACTALETEWDETRLSKAVAGGGRE